MIKKRKKKEKTEYQKKLKEFRKMSERHVLVLEAECKKTKRHMFFFIRPMFFARQAMNSLPS